MFGPNIVRNGFSLTRMLSGLNRGLSLANQVIPIYQQAKPMISNARQIIGAIKEFAHSDIPLSKPASNLANEKNTGQPSMQNMSNPVFFQ